MSLLLFLLLIGARESSSYVLDRFKSCCRIQLNSMRNNNIPEDHDVEDLLSKSYIPAVGVESTVFTLGTLRPLFPSEYELIFGFSVQLKQLAQKSEWPERNLESWERRVISSVIHSNSAPYSEADVDNKLRLFRKTILGLEKYRVNNPASIAEKYCDILRTCLRVEDAWGAAANALQYAGLDIRKHVYEKPPATNTSMMKPQSMFQVLSLDSLWRETRVTLLDLGADSNETNKMAADGSATWDQRYWSQVSMDTAAKVSVVDMQLLIMRVALRAMLSRPGYSFASVKCTDGGKIELAGLQPKLSSVRLLLSIEYDILREKESEPTSEMDANNEPTGPPPPGAGPDYKQNGFRNLLVMPSVIFTVGRRGEKQRLIELQKQQRQQRRVAD